MSKENVWPVVIFRARYGGVYEGGEWVAVNCYTDSRFLEGTMADDTTCQEWFADPPCPVAAGATPAEALAALGPVVEEWESRDPRALTVAEHQEIEARLQAEVPIIRRALNEPSPIMRELSRRRGRR